jgi:hypothetical protein
MFVSCIGLTNVTIPGSVTNIGLSAFAGCASLTDVTIPGSVANIGDNAFSQCDSLTGVFLAGNAPAADADVFGDDSSNPVIYYLPGTSGWSSPFAGRQALLWNPFIRAGDGSFGVQNNQFGFNITTTNNIPIVVEACTNLANPAWTPLQSLTLTNGSVHFSDPQWSNYPCRFYGLGFP